MFGLATFLVYERKRRIKAEKMVADVADTLAVRNTSHMGWIGEETHQEKGQTGPLEVENTQIPPGELYDGEVYEVGGTA